MNFRMKWTGYYVVNKTVNVQSVEEIQADSLSEALIVCRSAIIQKLSAGVVFGVEYLEPQVMDADYKLNMNEFLEFARSINAEGGTNSIEHLKKRGYKTAFRGQIILPTVKEND